MFLEILGIASAVIALLICVIWHLIRSRKRVILDNKNLKAQLFATDRAEKAVTNAIELENKTKGNIDSLIKNRGYFDSKG